MKISRIAAFLCAMAALFASAAPVSPDEALAAASAWMKDNPALGCDLGAQTGGIETYGGRDGKGSFYLVKTLKDDGSTAGFIAVSADRRLNPVLAFFSGAEFVADDTNPAWTMLTLDAAGCAVALEAEDAAATGSSVRALGASKKKTKHESKWAELLGESSGVRSLGASRRSSISDVRVEPLVETQWNQNGNGENLYTPLNRVCGCVATAGAQIMRYWRWPESKVTAVREYYGSVDGIGNWTMEGYPETEGGELVPWNPEFGGPYDWSNMPIPRSTSTAQKAAVGRLTRDVGIAAYMTYGSSGSGTTSGPLYKAYIDQFQYANATWQMLNPSAKAEETGQLEKALKCILPSLNLKCPCNVSVPGHAIIADGYGYNDDTLYIHFNLGWGGYQDGYWYNPPDLTGASSAFNSIDTVIYNIYPPSVSTLKNPTVASGRITSSSGKAVSGATVTVRNLSSGAASTAVSDDNGIYAIPLTAGEYSLSASNGGVAASRNLTVDATTPGNVVGAKFGSYNSQGTPNGIYDADLVLNQVPAPEFSLSQTPADTTVFDGYRDVSISCSLSGATIRYTLDGSDPTSSSTLYEGAIRVTSSCTVKARAFKTGILDSGIAEIKFNFLAPSDNLILNPAFESGTIAQNSETWTYSEAGGFLCPYWLFTAKAGLSVPGTTWVANSSTYGTKAAYIQTTTGTGTQSVSQNFAIPAPGTYKLSFMYSARPSHVGAATSVLLQKGDAAATELTSFTTTSSGVSEHAGLVDVGSAGTDWKLVFSQAETSADKANVIDNVVFQLAEQVAAPVISPSDGAKFFGTIQSVAISCATAGAEIRYTLDGTEPASSSALYEGPFEISATTTVKAKAFKPLYAASDVSSAAISRYAIIGENLADVSSPTAGEPQTLTIPVAGKYSFAYSYTGVEGRYGEPVELRIMKDGSTHTVATISASGAGTFTGGAEYEIAEPGDWQLVVWQSGSGTAPVSVSALSVSIPATEENRKLYWIYESVSTLGATGAWSVSPQTANEKIAIANQTTFTPSAPPAGRRAVLDITASFPDMAVADLQTPVGNGKTAIRLAADLETDATSFQVPVSENGTTTWKNLSGAGLPVPRTGVDYTFRFTLDYTNKTYTVSLIDGGTEIPMSCEGSQTLAFLPGAAAAEGTAVRFKGAGTVALMTGAYSDFAKEYFSVAFGEGAKVDVPVAWIQAKMTGITGMSSDADAVAALLEKGANGIVKWQSYCLGLDPRDAASVVLCEAAEAPGAQPGAIAMRVKNVTLAEGLSGVAVTARLDRRNADGSWTQVDSRALSAEGETVLYGTVTDGTAPDIFRIRVTIE